MRKWAGKGRSLTAQTWEEDWCGALWAKGGRGEGETQGRREAEWKEGTRWLRGKRKYLIKVG